MTHALSVEFITGDDHRRIVEGVHRSYRVEVGKLGMQLAIYRQALLDAGVEPPDKNQAELLQHWRDAATVVSTASEFVARLGPAKELLNDSWLKPEEA